MSSDIVINKMKDLEDKYPQGFYFPGSDNEIYNCLEAELKGRLIMVEEEMKFFDDSWVSNSEDHIASSNWQIVQDRLEWLKLERKQINDVLQKDDE